MKYRELVFVLCLVAVFCVWWGRTPAAVISTPPGPTVEEPKATPSVPAPLKINNSEFEMPEVPTFELTLIERGERMEETVLGGKLTTEVEAIIPLASDGTPYVFLVIDIDGYLWHWEPKDGQTEKTRTLKVGEQLSWTIKLDSFKPIEDGPKYRQPTGKNPLAMEAMIIEGGAIKPSPFMRSPFVSIQGDLFIPVPGAN